MADQSVRGRFVWHELVTPDANAAHAFYGKAIGWKPQPWEEDASYVMFAAQRGPIGATVAGNGSVPHWLPYIGTGDIDATIELARKKGGSVVKDVSTLSSGSRHAVLQDPYGARFGVYESAEDYGKITPPQPGEHSWHELMSTGYRAVFDFYAALFGWQKVDEHDMGPMGTYLIYGLDGIPFGGMMKTVDAGAASSWLSYVHVKDVNQTAKKVKSAGGQVINGPMEVPGGDWIVQAVDPQGAMFAAHASAANMKKSEKKEKKVKPEQLKLDTETPPAVQDPETPAEEQAPPAETPPVAPAEKPAKKRAPAKKAPAKEAPPAEAPAEEAPAKQAPAKKSPAKKAPARKKAPAKKAPAKAPAKKAGKKKSSKKSSKKSAGKTAGSKKTAAKKAGKKKAAAKSKTRSGGKKKAAKKPRKGK